MDLGESVCILDLLFSHLKSKLGVIMSIINEAVTRLKWSKECKAHTLAYSIHSIIAAIAIIYYALRFSNNCIS